MEIGKLRTSPQLEREGTWMQLKGASFKVASIHSREFRDERRRLLDRHRQGGGSLDGMDTHEQLAIVAPAYAKHVLVGWKDIEQDGKPYEFTADRAHEMLTDPQFRDVLIAIFVHATSSDNYRVESEKADAGN